MCPFVLLLIDDDIGSGEVFPGGGFDSWFLYEEARICPTLANAFAAP